MSYKNCADFHQEIPNVPVAFFDLDDTLIDKDTNSLWLRWRITKCKRGFLELLIGLHNYIYYKKGKLTPKKMNAYYWARTIGMSPDRYRYLSQRFYQEEGKNHILDEARQLIAVYKKKGIHLVMITGQDDFVTHPFFDSFQMDGCISNVRIINKNKFVGFQRPNCYGDGKITLARDYVKAMGIDLSDCAFYTDSISDLPMLKAVRHPIAVNPDPELAAIARQLNWRISYFAK